MSMNGTDILLQVNTGTTLLPVYETVGCQRDASFDETTDAIDVSCKNQRAGRFLPGRYGATLSLDALYVPTDAAYQAIKDAMRNGTLIMVLRDELGATLETASAVVTALGEKGPDQDAATVAISMTIDGEWAESGT